MVAQGARGSPGSGEGAGPRRRRPWPGVTAAGSCEGVLAHGEGALPRACRGLSAISRVGAAPRDCPRRAADARGRKSVNQPEEVSRPRRALRKQLDPGPGVQLSVMTLGRRCCSDKGPR